MTKRRNRVVGGLLAVALFSARLSAQVQTEVPAYRPARKAGHGRAHQGPRHRIGGQPGGRCG